MIAFNKVIVYAIVCTLMCYLANANAAKLKKRDFVKLADQMGVVLLDVNWGRKWACGDYENAQLVSLRFEKTSRRPDEHDKYTEIVLKTPSRLFVNPVFLNYGFLVEPGTYAFTGWSVKVAKSATDVGLIKATRKELVEGGEFYGGTFSVGASEVIYVGNFHLDCYYSPIPWRYYTADKNDFADHIDQYKDEFKFLQDTKVEFRLLETENYGTSYVLPE